MAAPTKIFIKVESSSEQQENLKNIRKQFKPLQATATDKENLAGRSIITSKGHLKSKLDSETDSTPNIESTKRKKCEKSTQTVAVIDKELIDKKREITTEDLTSTDAPSEYYWELLAEKRRQALEETLEENQKLYERIESLESELEISRKMVEETNGLVEVLTEMLNENETNDESQNCSTSRESEKFDESQQNENDSDSE